MNRATLFLKIQARNIVLLLNRVYDFFVPLTSIKEKKGEIILFEYAGIGDFLLNTIYVDSYIRHFDNNKITLIVSNLVFPIAQKYFGDYGHVKVMSVTLKKFEYNPKYRHTFVREVGKVDTLFCIHPSITITSVFIASKLQAKKYIHYEGEPGFYTSNTINIPNREVIKNPYNKKNVHILYHFNEISNYITKKKFDFDTIDKTLNKFFLSYSFKNSSLIVDKNYMVILTDSSSPQRNFSVKQWQRFLDEIPSHIVLVQIGINKMELKHDKLINLVGKTTLLESMSIISGARAVIGNETGLAHFAYLRGVLTFVVLGGGHYGRFLPSPAKFDVECITHQMECFVCGWSCGKIGSYQEQFPCVRDIDVNIILEKLKKKDYCE